MAIYCNKTVTTEFDVIEGVKFLGTPNNALVIGNSNDIHMYQKNVEGVFCCFKKHTYNVRHISVSHDYQYMISTSTNQEILLWDVNTQTAQYINGFYGDPVCCDQGGSVTHPALFACATNKHISYMWDLRQSRDIPVIRKYSNTPINALLLGINSFKIVYSNGILKLFDFRNMFAIKNILFHHPIYSASNHNFSTFVLSGKNRIYLMDAVNTTMMKQCVSANTNNEKIDCAVSAKGGYILSGSVSGRLNLWNIFPTTVEPIFSVVHTSGRQLRHLDYFHTRNVYLTGCMNTIKFWAE